MFPIRFLPEDRTYMAQQPTELMLAAAACDIWVEQPCGSKAICGKCRVRVKEGEAAISDADRRLLSRDELAQGWRLACQLDLGAATVIEIPAITRSVAAKPFGPVELFPMGFCPNITKRYIELDAPSDENQYADFDLVARSLGAEKLTADRSLIHSAAQRFREADYRVTVALSGNE